MCDKPTDPDMCDKPTDPDMCDKPSDPQEDDLYTPLCLPPNLKFPDYEPSVNVDDENDDEEEDEYEYRLRTLLECIRKERLRSEGKETDDEPEDKKSEGSESEESEEENEPDSEYKVWKPFSSPSDNILLQNFVHVKDPVIEVEEWRGCPVCGDLNKTHIVTGCPWLRKIPKDKTPGPHFDIYCIECGMLGRDCCSKGVAAVLKSCGLCWLSGHWSKTCPYYKPKNP